MYPWILLLLLFSVESKIQPGIFYFPSEESVRDDPEGPTFPRTFFRDSKLEGYFSCKQSAVDARSNYTLSIWTFKTECYRTFNDEIDRQQIRGQVNFLLAPTADNEKYLSRWKPSWIRCYDMDIRCDSYSPAIPQFKDENWRQCKGYKQILNKYMSENNEEVDAGNDESESDGAANEEEQNVIDDQGSRKRRETENYLKHGIKELTQGSDPLGSKKTYPLINITKTGSFYIGWQVSGSQNSPVNRDYVTLTIKARDVNLNSYLEAKDYPLLIFFGIMSGVYALLALIWMIVCCLHYRDILQIQLWIGGMIALSMIEMSVFCSKYQAVNNGHEVSTALVVFSEILATLKHGLSRILILVICMGYGIVKPRLGTTRHLIIALGLAYCLFVGIDSIYVKLSSPHSTLTKRQRLYAYIPQAVVNAILIWWIIASLVSTIRTLRARRNVIKLTLYRHFSNALAFSIVACIAFEVWWMQLTKDGCIQNWKEYWLSDEIFWNLIFCMILMIIMFLWRPTVNNSRYAFSPLLDTDEDESEETIDNAFEGMKMRNVKKNGGAKVDANDIDDDLKWVEENIPSTLGETVFEKLMDSDEEVEQRKFEISKMQ